jgi:hypothetical protein
MANLLSTSVTGTVNSTGNMTAAGFTGNANVGGTGAATWHPSGIYSGGTNWLYGTMYLNNNTINDVGSITTASHGTSANWKSAYDWGNHASAGYITSSGSISGNAATATNVAWTGVTGRPTALSQFSNDLGNYGGWITSSGSISGTAARATRANGNFYIDDNYGNTVVGVYTSTRYQGVFAMGDSYKLPSDGSSTGSLYGMAWSHPNAGGVAGNLNTHGLLVMENGTFLAAVSGSIRARDDMRAPAIYDSGSRVAISRGEGRNYVDYSRYVYNNGAYSGVGWTEPSDLGVRYAASANYATSAGSAGSAGSVSWGNVSDRPGWLAGGSYITDHSNANDWRNSGFYENGGGGSNWPSQTWYNSLNVRHSNQGNYHGFQIAMSYYDNNFWFRSYQGSGTFQSWDYAISNRTIGSQSVSYASSAGNADTVDGYHGSNYLGYNGNSYYQVNTWLQMNGTHGIYYPSYNGAHFYVNTTTSYTQFRLDGSRGGYGGIWDSYSAVHGIMYDSAGNGGVYREANGRWYWYHHLGNNCTGISTSTTSSSYRAYIGGSLYAEGDIVAYSDARKKSEIVTIDSALEKVKQLRGVYYVRTDEAEKGRQTGVIAQEINEVLPEVVTYAADIDEYGVKYGNIVGVLIEAIKEQQTQIEDLKLEIKKLRGE